MSEKKRYHPAMVVEQCTPLLCKYAIKAYRCMVCPYSSHCVCMVCTMRIEICIYTCIYIYAQRPPLDPQFPCVFHRTSWSYRATDASARICQQQSSYIILYLQFEHVIIIHEQDSRHENWALLETPPTRRQGELRVLAQSRCLAIHWWRHGSVFAQTKLM